MVEAHSPIVAIVPLRSPGEGMTRLEGRLMRSERAALAAAMLADVARALTAGGVHRIVVAANGTGAADAARALGLDVTLDPPSTHDVNAALRAAMPRLGTVGTLMIVTADLPRLTVADVRAVLDEDAQVVVAATNDGGTGALLRRPPNVIGTAYGPGSAAKHMRLARNLGVATVAVDSPGFKLDIDTFDDLLELVEEPVGGATGQVINKIRPRLERARDRIAEIEGEAVRS